MLRISLQVVAGLITGIAAMNAGATTVYDQGCWWEETTASTIDKWGGHYFVLEGADGIDYLAEGSYRGDHGFEKRTIGWQPTGIAVDKYRNIWVPRSGTNSLFRFQATVFGSANSYALLPSGMKFSGRDNVFTNGPGTILFAEVTQSTIITKLAVFEIATGTPVYVGTVPLSPFGGQPIVKLMPGGGHWELHVFQRVVNGKINRSVIHMAGVDVVDVASIDPTLYTNPNLNASDCGDITSSDGGDLLICNSTTYSNMIHAFRISGTPGVSEMWWGSAWVANNIRLMSGVSGNSQDEVIAVSGTFSNIHRITTDSVQWDLNPILETGTGPGGKDIRWGMQQMSAYFVVQDYAGEGLNPPCFRAWGFSVWDIN